MNKSSTENKIERYDVIIVGAGVSGLMLAKLLDGSNLKVLLIERKREINIKPKSFGTFTNIAVEHNLEKYIEKYFDTWAFYGPNVKASRFEKGIMCLVNYEKWSKSLVWKNVLIKTGVNLISAKRVKGGIILTDKNESYFGKLIVDSSGYSQVVRKLLGLKINKQTGLSYEVELDNCDLPIKDEASFILNFKVTNSGGWIYGLSKTKAQYGWADFYPESDSDLNNLKERTLLAMKKIFPNKDWFKNSKIIYKYGRFGPTGNTGHSVYDNFISIGDAGGVGTPVTLEGFREAIDSAKMAAETIKKVDNFSKKELKIFLDLFHDKYGKYYKMHKLVRYIYLHWARNEEIDRWISNFKKLNKEDFFKLIKGELTIRLVIKTLDFILIKDLGLNMINNLLPRFLRFRQLISKSKKEIINDIR